MHPSVFPSPKIESKYSSSILGAWGIFRPHPAVLTAYSWFQAQGSLPQVPRDYIWYGGGTWVSKVQDLNPKSSLSDLSILFNNDLAIKERKKEGKVFAGTPLCIRCLWAEKREFPIRSTCLCIAKTEAPSSRLSIAMLKSERERGWLSAQEGHLICWDQVGSLLV